jgi:hypothetical protein
MICLNCHSGGVQKEFLLLVDKIHIFPGSKDEIK